MTDLKLLPKSALVYTSEVDHPDWNYRRCSVPCSACGSGSS